MEALDGLSEALPLWASLLIVTGIILALAAVAGLLARRFARKASPPKPSQRWRRQSEPSRLSATMSERGIAEIRDEIAAERVGLNDDLSKLQSEIRSLALFTAAGLAAVGLVTWRMGRRKGAQTVWKLAK